MTPSEQEEQTGYSGPTTPSSAQAGSTGLERPLHPQSEQATMNMGLLQAVISTENQSVFNGFAAFQCGPFGAFNPQYQLTAPQSSTFLDRVQTVPDTEHDLHRLKTLRLSKRNNALYVSPLAKPTFQSSDDTLFPLMEKALEFIASPRQVLLLLGDSGGGKSTFNLQLEHTLWKEYKAGDPIPLHINLPTIDNPLQDMIAQQLQRLDFSDSQIQDLKQHRQFIVICDGYDESQLKKNLYSTNLLNQPGQWRAKLVISCRSQYLGSDYRARFYPTVDRYEVVAASSGLQEAVIAPFSRSQIQQYVEQYVQRALPQTTSSTQPAWRVKDYMDKLVKIPNLMDLVSNPFLLTLALRALPKVVRSQMDLSDIRLTRVMLYDNFTDQWLENNKHRLQDSPLSPEAQSTYDRLLEEGFIQQALSYQKELAAAIFQHQRGNPVVEYSPLRESRSWKAAFFGPNIHTTMLRDSSPLTRFGNQYRFLHRSLLEYLYSRVISDPLDLDDHAVEDGFVEADAFAPLSDHPLNRRSIVDEPSILQFLAERVELDLLFQAFLLVAIEDSKTDARVSRAAANAISILVRARVPFHGANLRGIKIPGADLRGGEFDSADLEGADLSEVNFSKAWLRQANLSKTRMEGAQFGELPYLQLEDGVLGCIFSPDGGLLAVSSSVFRISIYDTKTWTRIAHYPGGAVMAVSPINHELAKESLDNTVELGDILTGVSRLVLSGHADEVTCISYSPDGTQIATSSEDATVRIWSTLSGATLHTLSGHTNAVTGVAFSPTGLQLASCSEDETVRIWNAKTGEPMKILEDHDEGVFCVAYSPDGHQIASGGEDGSVYFWDPYSGDLSYTLPGNLFRITGISYSLDGYQVACSTSDGTIRLWDPRNGDSYNPLSGHVFGVRCVAYSPVDQCIVSGGIDGIVRLWAAGGGGLEDPGSGCDFEGIECFDISPDCSRIVTGRDDGTMRLWEALTGRERAVMTGHTEAVWDVKFSPCGNRIASASVDFTVRLWCGQTGTPLHIFEGHTGRVRSIDFSPSGHQLVSGGGDLIVRTWNTQTGEPRFSLRGHTNYINEVAYSPNAHQVASCSDDLTVRLWCSRTGEQLHSMTLSMTVAQLAYSPDGQHLISGSLGGGLSYWNTQSGAHDNRLDGITCQIYACSFSPDGKLIATSTEDSMLRLWDIRSGGCVEVYRSMIGRTFSIKWKQGPDCMYLASIFAGTDSIRVWRLVEIEGTYMLHLIWGTGFNELVLTGVTMDDIVGLSLANLELLKQRAVPIELDVLRRDESTDDSSDKEMDRPSDEEMDSSSDEDEDTDGLERSSDGWSNDE